MVPLSLGEYVLPQDPRPVSRPGQAVKDTERGTSTLKTAAKSHTVKQSSRIT